jgi:hypothetical protein
MNEYFDLYKKLIETHDLACEDGANPQLQKLMEEYNTKEFVVIYRYGNECPFQFYVPRYKEAERGD